MNGSKRITSLLLCLIFILAAAAPAGAAVEPRRAAEKRVVKVAYPQQPYLTEIDESGNYYGYSYDYLKKVAEFANWKLEYITYPDLPVDEQLLCGLEMVKTGQADLIGGALQTQGMEEQYLYPEKNYGTVFTTLDVLDTNFSINETNYMQMGKLRIAVLKKAKTRNAELEAFVLNTGLNCDYVFCDTMDEQVACLKNGSADAMVKVSLTFKPGLKQIAEFAPRPYYFISGPGKEALIAEMDEAIDKINMTDPYFQSRLRSKYFVHTMADFELSDAELEYVSGNPTLRVLILPRYAPVSFVNRKEELCGMSVSILNRIGEKAGIEFQYHVLGEEEKAADEIATGAYDVVIGPPHSNTFAENNGLVLSQPYLETGLTMFIRKDAEEKPKSECVLALIRDVANPICYEYKEIHYYDDIEQCLAAVDKGKADYGYGSSYVIDYYTSQSSHRNLHYLSLSGYSREIGFYVPNTGDTQLLSIINKYVRSMPEKDVHRYLSKALEQRYDGGLAEVVQSNPLLVIAVVVAFLFLLLLTVTLAVYGKVNRRRNQKLQAAFAAKSDFLSRMSHDMRTPMNGILGLTGLTLELEALPNEAEDNLSKIQESAEYLLSLINDTLDMNKIESNKIVLNRQPTDLHVFFEQMMSVVEVTAEQKGVHFIATPDADEFPQVYLDKVRVQQIFFNLISNAIKFTPENGTVEVRGECEAVGQTAVCTTLTVRDTGIGIDSEFLPKIFEPFEQEYNSTTANYAGTGLGLAIVKNLVNLMDGTISVRSEKGLGAEFIVRITFDIAEEPETQKAPAAAPRGMLKGRRVLLCEDHPLNAQIATKLLEKKGVLVECADNGQTAVERFQTAPAGWFDAVLMDIRMPIMDGLTATRYIRSLERKDAKSVPIIAMTANAFDEDVRKSLEAGMDAHLAKPIDTAALFETLCRLIAGSEEPKE